MPDRRSRPHPDRRLPRRHAAALAALSLLVTATVALARSWPGATADADPTALAVRAPAAAHPAAPRDNRPRADDPPGWTRVDTGPFSVALPPGWRYEPLEGIDSFVGELVGDGIELMFDYGAYWNSVPRDASGHDVDRTHVDFRAADIFRPHDPSDVLALYIEHTDDFGAFDGPNHLSIVGHDVPAAARERVVQIYRSVRFGRVIADGGRWVPVAPPDGAVGLFDVDAFEGGLPVIAGTRYDGPTSHAVVLRHVAGRWEETTLESGTGVATWSIAGDWAATLRALYRYDAASKRWTHQAAVLADDMLRDVALDRSRFEEDGWALSEDGVIRLANGQAITSDGGWGATHGTALDVLSRGPLFDRGRPPADALAVGFDGVTAFDGRRWAPVAAGAQPINVVSADLVAPGEAWIAGSRSTPPYGGAIGHWRDGRTVAAPVTATTGLWSIDLVNPAEGWAVGGGLDAEHAAELWRFRDGVWERQPPPCDCHLHAVQALPDGRAYAVGMVMSDDVMARRAVVLRYEPGGPTPTPDSGTTATATPGGSATATATPGVTSTQAAATATGAATATSGGRAWMPWAGR